MTSLLGSLMTLFFVMMVLTITGNGQELQIGVFTSSESHFHLWNKSVQTNPTTWSERVLIITYIAIPVADSLNVVKVWNTLCSHIDNGVRIYLSTLSCDHSNMMQKSIENKLLSHDLPLLKLKSCDSRCKGLCVPVSTNHHDVIDLIVSIAAHQRWKDLAIIYDPRNTTIQDLNIMLEELSLTGVAVVLLSFKDLADPDKIRWQLQHVTGFVVMPTNQYQVQYVLKQARIGSLDLLGPSFQWLLFFHQTWNISAIVTLLEEGDNVAMITKTGTRINSSTAINYVEQALNKVTASETIYWAPDNVSCFNTHTWLYGKDLAYRMKNELLDDTSQGYNVLSLRRESAQELGFVGVAEYNQSQGLSLTYHALFPQLFEGFNNRTFKITTTHSPPFTIDLRNGSWGGIVFDLVSELAKSLNFSYEIVPSDSFGIEKDGVYTGMMGLIQRKEVDFGAAPFTLTAPREMVADFTTPFWVDPSLLIMKKPSLLRSQLFVCFDPFTVYVWITLALSTLVVGTIIWGFNKVDPTLPHLLRVKRTINNLDLNIWQVFGALFQQGMVHDPESHSARIVTSFWWLFTIVIVGTYNGNLIAYLTSPSIRVPVNNLKGLLESSLSFGFLAETATHQMFVNSSADSIYRQLWDRIKDRPEHYIMHTSEDGLHRVIMDDSYVFLCHKSFYDTISISSPSFEEKKCDVMRSEEEFLNDMYALAFPKGSLYTEQFSVRIMHLLEAGLFERWRHKWYGIDNRCTGLERSVAQTNIGFGESQGAFYVLVMGLFLSVLLFSVEKYLQYKKRQILAGHAGKNHEEPVAKESNSQARNGSPVFHSVFSQNGIHQNNVTRVGDIQLHTSETSSTVLSEFESLKVEDTSCTNSAFNLNGIYTKVFNKSNIDSLSLPNGSQTRVKTYNGELGEPRSIYNTVFSSTSELGSPVQKSSAEDMTDQYGTVHYTLTSECTQL